MDHLQRGSIFFILHSSFSVSSEQSVEQSDYGCSHDQKAEQTVEQGDGPHLEAGTYPVEGCRKAEPPDDGSRHDPRIAEGLLGGMFRYDKAEPGKEGQEENDDEGIADRNGKPREHVVPQRTSPSACLVGLCRLAVVRVCTEAEEQDAAEQLKVVDGGGALDEVHDEAHAEARNQSIDEVAQGSPDASCKAVPAPLVEGTLHRKDPDGSHRRTCHDSDHHAPHREVNGIDWFYPQGWFTI